MGGAKIGADMGGGHVVVVGGGITGLAAAYRLLGRGAAVTLLEAGPRLGGKLLVGEVAGVRVDLGAESMLARRPEAVALARETGLGDRLRTPATATAALWTRGALRPMPKGHVMGVPGDAEALAGVLSEEGLRRIDQDRTLPRTEVGEDVAVGEYVARRLGREVVDRLVEPLLGGVYAGDAYRISMRAAVPQLFEAARAHTSLTEGVREIQRRAAGQQRPGPVFMGIEGGVGSLPAAVADAVRARGGEILTGAPVVGLRRTPPGAGAGSGGAAAAGADAGGAATGRWRITVGDPAGGHFGRTLDADAVVLAVPAPAAARLLAAESPAAAAELGGVEYASMALVTLAYRRAEAALPEGSGFLVPPVDGHTIKASTFSGQKWSWVADEDPGLLVLRTSVGRHGEERILERTDAELVAVSRRDLSAATGLAAAPVASVVTRWDQGLPQYPVGHQARVARVRDQLADLSGLVVCGAAYDGVGIPACIASAHAAADRLAGDHRGAAELAAHPVQSLHGGAGE
ncbi:protoporphyrinogen oxidase HemY' [Streptomyces sulfonofaciens]|uniref:Coproporphyrinogen III oxidase n=1 Tax=Streptomyces sulfonofaciens TaxID=68272 RepID=A0A919GI88_9ACTN|nr:protoporphyrinogen oxidase [Streptomyces sulfonofaciens]GHH84906.1 protoporphyrinogen oxidase HemY' [Streptomyces sulfonofaciens]